MSTELWKSINNLAERWREIPAVKETVRDLPRGARAAPSAMGKMLDELRVYGMHAHALRLWRDVNGMLSSEYLQDLRRPPALDSWLSSAKAVEIEYREQLAWVRAQLPGYPHLRVPHLVDGTTYTTQEFTWKVSWAKAHFASGYQMQSAPFVQIDGIATDLRPELTSVVRALKLTPSWQRFELARAALTEGDKKELSVVSQRLRKALQPAQIDAVAPDYATERDTYRAGELERAMEELSGTAADYAQAFEWVADDIEFVLDEVLQQLVAFGKPVDIGVVTEIDFTGPDLVEVTPERLVLGVGGLVHLADPLINEIGQIRSQHLGEHEGRTSERLGLWLLRGAALAWNPRP